MNDYGYTDVNGNHFESYEHACDVYGINTPVQLASEARYWFEVECVELQDAMEARGGPEVAAWGEFYNAADDMPF